MDAAYYTAKELLMTERTYKKDLQVIAVVSLLFLVVTKVNIVTYRLLVNLLMAHILPWHPQPPAQVSCLGNPAQYTSF